MNNVHYVNNVQELSPIQAAVAALDTMEMIVDHMQAEQQPNQEVQAVVLVTRVVDILPAK